MISLSSTLLPTLITTLLLVCATGLAPQMAPYKPANLPYDQLPDFTYVVDPGDNIRLPVLPNGETIYSH